MGKSRFIADRTGHRHVWCEGWCPVEADTERASEPASGSQPVSKKLGPNRVLSFQRLPG